jgi:hypothetical protein
VEVEVVAPAPAVAVEVAVEVEVVAPAPAVAVAARSRLFSRRMATHARRVLLRRTGAWLKPRDIPAFRSRDVLAPLDLVVRYAELSLT